MEQHCLYYELNTEVIEGAVQVSFILRARERIAFTFKYIRNTKTEEMALEQ